MAQSQYMICKAKWLKTLGFCLCWWEFIKLGDYSRTQRRRVFVIVTATEVLKRER